MIFCPLLWRMRRCRKSMNPLATNFSLNTRKDRCPLLEIAEITFAPKRWPVPSITGVSPTGLQDLPDGVIGAQAHLIGPQDQGFLASRTGLDRWIALIKPRERTLANRAKRERSRGAHNPHAVRPHRRRHPSAPRLRLRLIATMPRRRQVPHSAKRHARQSAARQVGSHLSVTRVRGRRSAARG